MNSIRDFFDFINKECNYVVLRNWDNIFTSSVYVEGHEDIDILCDDLRTFIKVTNAQRVHKNKYKDNFIISIGGNDVRFDIRHVGDGYYPESWEEEMLNNRSLNQEGVYIISQEDYVYSLSYHALFQKNKVSSDYLNKLKTAFLSFNQKIITSERELLKELSDYCSNKAYQFEIPTDPGVVINWNNIRAIKTKYNAWRLSLRGVIRSYDKIMRHFR